MGRTLSATIIIVILAYFTLLFSTFYTSTNVTSIYEYNSTSNLTATGGGLANSVLTQPYCGDTRFNGLENDLQSANIEPTLLVKYDYIRDQQSCERYEGFSWVEDTFLYFWGTGTYKCSGTLNYTYYNNDVDENFTSSFTNKYLFKQNVGHYDLNNLYDLNTSQDTCQDFGFDWIQENKTLSIEASQDSVTSVWTIIKQSLTFNLQLSTSSDLVNDLTSLFFVWLPLMIMLFNIFIMLPFVGGN